MSDQKNAPGDQVDTLRERLEALDIDFGYAVGNLGEDCKDDTVDKIIAICQGVDKEAVGKELNRLDGVLDIFDLCEEDMQKLKVWVANARWAQVAPPGQDSMVSDE